jgi:tRNA (guanine-N7-)-methyltransferase
MVEFLRKFYKDNNTPFLWHYALALDDAKKPVFVAESNRKGSPQEAIFEFFENSVGKKFILEIGSGKGAFICQYAQMFPENCILGAEWDAYCANLTAKKIAKLGLKNAAVMHGDLFYFLRDLMPAHSIDEVHTYFPDPWPKRKQHKNRLILREGFLEELHRALKPGKRLFYWATDHEEYNSLALRAFKNFAHTKILEENTASPTYGIETGFEKKYKKEGRKIYRSIIEWRVEKSCTNFAE